jgi:hypothetical protein
LQGICKARGIEFKGSQYTLVRILEQDDHERKRQDGVAYESKVAEQRERRLRELIPAPGFNMSPLELRRIDWKYSLPDSRTLCPAHPRFLAHRSRRSFELEHHLIRGTPGGNLDDSFSTTDASYKFETNRYSTGNQSGTGEQNYDGNPDAYND